VYLLLANKFLYKKKKYNTPHKVLSTQNPKLACNSEGTEELPEDGTQLPKHVGAAK
jgi:hypothetical protein